MPEVYKIYSGSVASTGTQSTGFVFSSSLSQSISRHGSIFALYCGLCQIRQVVGLCDDCLMASSKIGLYGIMLLTSIPQLALITTLGLASSILVASS